MASISTLPDEMVQYILSFLPVQNEHGAWLCRWRLSVMLVSKRWHRLFEPYLYRSLMFYHGEPRVRPKDITKVLRERPHLCAFVQDVHFDKPPHGNDIPQYDRFVDLVLPISRLVMEHGGDKHSTTLVQRIVNTDCLRELTTTDMSLRTVLVWFHESQLDRLEISNSHWQFCQYTPLPPTSSDSLTTTAINTSETYTPKTLQEISPHLIDRTGRLKHLTLTRCKIKPAQLSLFLHWPAALETFELTDSAYDYSATDPNPALDRHQASLRKIRLGRFLKQHHTGRLAWIPATNYWRGRQENNPLHFASYQHLTTLHLSAFNTALEQHATSTGLALAAPNLTHLTLDFSPEVPGHGASFQTFSTDAVTWLADFSSSLREQQAAQRTALGLTPPSPVFRALHVEYHPFWPQGQYGAVGQRYITSLRCDRTYPWHYLDAARAVLARHGVSLTWLQPSTTLADWESEVTETVERMEAEIQERLAQQSLPDRSRFAWI